HEALRHDRSFHRFHSGGDSTAVIVSKNNDERDIDFLNRKLQGSQHGIIDNLARGTNNEYITKANIEDNLCCEPRIGATKNHRVWTLRLSQCRTPASILVGMIDGAFYESIVAGLEQPPGFLR